MKKVLLTSTALVAFAGAAAAEVTLSGWAEMGVVGGSGQTAEFWQDIDVNFDMSGETDGGLTFGASVDLDSAGSLGNTTGVMGDVSVFASGEFGTVTLGDTDGALDWALTDAASWGNPGSIADDETAHWGRQDTYLDGDYDGQILRYDYTYEDFGFAVSLEQDDLSDQALDDADRKRYDYNWAVGARWNPELGAGTMKLGIGYQQNDNGQVAFGLTDQQVNTLDEDLTDAFGGLDFDALTDQARGAIAFLDDVFSYTPNNNESDTLNIALGENTKVWGLSAGYEMDNGFSFGGSYSDWDSKALKEGSHWGVGAGYAWEAFSISANYGEHKFKYKGGSRLTAKGYGVAAGYDLGGGLSVLAGYGKTEGTIKFDSEYEGVDAAGIGTGTFYDINTSVDTDNDTYSLGLSMAF